MSDEEPTMNGSPYKGENGDAVILCFRILMDCLDSSKPHDVQTWLTIFLQSLCNWDFMTQTQHIFFYIKLVEIAMKKNRVCL